MNLIRKARLSKGWNQTDLAKALGVTQLTVSNWETGITFPTPRRIKDVAEVLGISAEELVREKAG